MRALVYKSTGSWYQVFGDDGHFYKARTKGKLRINGITSTNPIAVGDYVQMEQEQNADDYMITAVDARRNYVNRISPHNKNQHHIVAANLDQSLLFATLKDPKTSLGFIDRFLVTCEAFHIPAILVFNKADLYKKNELEEYDLIKSIYEKIGYKVMLVSVEKNTGLDELKATLANKITLLSGHSGVGKSTFINHLLPHLQQRTTDVSEWSGKGMHTTTFAEMFDLENGGKIIDTPGIRELDIADISKDELSHYFPEMRVLVNNCKFNNCLHENEPGCAVKSAVNSGDVSELRYISYLTIKESIKGKAY